MWLRSMVMYHAVLGKKNARDLRKVTPIKVKTVMADAEL